MVQNDDHPFASWGGVLHVILATTTFPWTVARQIPASASSPSDAVRDHPGVTG